MEEKKDQKLKEYLKSNYSSGNFFLESELDLSEINTISGTKGYKEINSLIQKFLIEGFLIKCYKNGHILLKINDMSETTKKNIAQPEKKSDIHDFEIKKNKLKEFSETVPKTVHLPILKEGINFNPFSRNFLSKRNVSSDDMNEISTNIANTFIEQNKNMISVWKEFKTIYNTFDALDKDYIQRIMVNIEATKKANENAIQGLQENQKLFEAQKSVIKVLKKHKDDLESLTHLKNIDDLYNSYQNFKLYQDKTNTDLFLAQNRIDDKIENFKNNDLTLNKDFNDLRSNYYLFIEDTKKKDKENEIIKEKIIKKVRYLSILTFFSIIISTISIILFIINGGL
ncbi:Rhoptry protein [Lactococcus lactis subsp. lactis]|uniref:hypothetical protein n=1 Tax=Lactococcus lactis TaxID=1358 RepID=UPI00071D1233|nr:hypothetical protein [Lactococcus lactis]KST94145.1 Rhoptry protein [Lactococcus lactis subsp. lactis]